MTPSILLIAPESIAKPVTTALRSELGAEVETAAERRAGLARLRRQEFDLVLLEESLIATDPEAADLLYQGASATPLIEINFVISGVQRIVRQVRSALHRRTRDQALARAAASATLQSELSEALAGLLLESQLALREASPEQQPKLRNVVDLANGLRDRLRA
jgi:CheY-like chemotaxis protein